ncbi:membrane-associated protein, putative [Bodo saltans]|uniref:carbonic anhydrase n=1 Tax=Bodo saltans TaxID=75058 RepID=A0A0S4JQN7_BODSA|nr:membrane-associated protein, putative [Bodo saltans]|eukprot:CUG92503.1 membrane-associated protein, putative [Bodo saltans]
METRLILLLLAATLCVNGFQSTIQAPFAWDYSGALGQSTWWPVGFYQCDATAFPNQSPVDIVTASVSSVATVPIIVQPVGDPIRTVSVIMQPTTTNVLRAETWPSRNLVYILMNGATASASNLFVFHHIAVHFPSQNTIDGTASDGELSFVFFPVNSSRPYSEYAQNGVNFVIPFVSNSAAAVTRLDKMLGSFANSKTTCVAEMLFVLPTFGLSAMYNGALAFPPCTQSLTTVVSMTALALNPSTVAALKALSPTTVTARATQPIGTRTLIPASVTWNGVYLVPPTTAEMMARPQRYSIESPPLDVTTTAYGYGALSIGMLCVLLLACLAVQVYERVVFVSTIRDTWVNPISQAATFGCAPSESDAEETDEENEEDEEGDEEEGDEM